jgi:hypothetical protein
MNGVDVVTRALGTTGKGCRYKLGAGGRLWHKQTPWTPALMTCDCSGFVAWCLGVDRHTDHPYYKAFNGGWLETTAVERDALAEGVGMFDHVPWADAALGDVLVWGDRDGHQGHIGVVTDCSTGPVKVVHCSVGNERRTQDAIRETGVEVFLQNRAIVARYAGLV